MPGTVLHLQRAFNVFRFTIRVAYPARMPSPSPAGSLPGAGPFFLNLWKQAWSVGGIGNRRAVNAMVLQPFLSYTRKTATSLGLDRVLIAGQPVSFTSGPWFPPPSRFRTGLGPAFSDDFPK